MCRVLMFCRCRDDSRMATLKIDRQEVNCSKCLIFTAKLFYRTYFVSVYRYRFAIVMHLMQIIQKLLDIFTYLFDIY